MALADYKKEDLEKRFNHKENCEKMDAIMGGEASDTSKKYNNL